jgi:hypothetical protein
VVLEHPPYGFDLVPWTTTSLIHTKVLYVANNLPVTNEFKKPVDALLATQLIFFGGHKNAYLRLG